MVLDTVGKMKKFLEGYDASTPILLYDSSSGGFGAICLNERRSSPGLNKDEPYSEERFLKALNEKLRGLFTDEETQNRVVDEAVKASKHFLSVEMVGKSDYKKFKVLENASDNAEVGK